MVIVNVPMIEQLKHRMREEVTYAYPIPVDVSVHPLTTTVSVLFIGFDDGSIYCVPERHPDALEVFQLDFSEARGLVVPEKKTFLHLYPNLQDIPVYDGYTIPYLASGSVPAQIHKTPAFIQSLSAKYRFKNMTLATPLTILCQQGKEVIEWLVQTFKTRTWATDAYSFLNDVAIPTLTSVEANGIWTAEGTPEYTKYNLYTTTGRPSNAFGGVNYAALNKHDGSRDKYVSRYGENGTLVQFDYEAFHLRLLANIIGYSLPTTSVHRYLAEQYYGKTDISPEEYEASKARTFALMYGHTKDSDNIEFFTKVREYINSFKSNQFTSLGGRTVTVHDPNPAKVFNYFMQLTETEVALRRVQRVISATRHLKIHVVLYTYDAVLLDVHNDNLVHMDDVSTELSGGKFPVRQYRGPNYGNLQDISVP